MCLCDSIGRQHLRVHDKLCADRRYRGNFDIEDSLSARLPLPVARVQETREGWRIDFALADGLPAAASFEVGAAIVPSIADHSMNRFWLRIVSESEEHVWGGGEQMSYFDLTGRRFPLWTSEPGVGRDKTSEITFRADVMGRAGGDFWNTNYPQPTLLSSRKYALHVETSAYSSLDFRSRAFHEIEVWNVPDRIELFAAPTFVALVTALSDRFGRQPP